MRSIKTFGLAVLAAVAAMALVGASSAMATSTQLCTSHVEPCGSGVTSQVLHLKANEVWLMHSLSLLAESNLLCLSQLVEVDYGFLAAPQDIEILMFTLGGCGTEGSGGSHSNCTITALHLPWLAHLLKTALNLGTFEVLSGSGGQALTLIKCTVFGFIKIECTYEAEGLASHVDGATANNNGLLLPEGTVPKVSSGSLCPEESEITLGTLEPLTAGYIVG